MNKSERIEKSKMRGGKMGKKRKSRKRNALRIRVEKGVHAIAIKEPHLMLMKSQEALPLILRYAGSSR